MLLKIIFSFPLNIQLGQTGPGVPYRHILEALKRWETGENRLTVLHGIEQGMAEVSLENGIVHDLVASFEDLRADAFLGCGCASLLQMREAKSLGVRTATLWFSTHYRNAYVILKELYARQGITREPINPLLMWRDEYEHALSDLIIVPSKQCAETYEREEACRGKVRIAEFGVDAERLHPSEPPKRFTLLFTGGNWLRKGLPYLIQAWQELRLKGSELVVLGGAKGSTYATKFFGWVKDEEVPAFYRKASCFVSPSLEEGQALAILESMASGTPVIATRESGVEFRDYGEGIYVAPKDVEGLKQAILYMHDHPKEREEMGHRAREFALKRPWDKFGDRVVEILMDEKR